MKTAYMTPEDIIWLLKNLPPDIVRHIIASYNPQCFFIMDAKWLLEYDWAKQCKITFNISTGGLYSYYLMTQRLSEKDIQIVGSCYHTIIKKGNTIMSCGENTRGQLGLGDTIQRTKFEKIKNVRLLNGDIVPLPKNIIQVTAGLLHTVLLTADGNLFMCGYNILTNKQQILFEEIGNMPKNIVHVACGYWYTIILTADGMLMGAGSNVYGQLGLGTTSEAPKFEEITNAPKDIIKIACGSHHTVVLTANGTIMACGYNGYGQLGLGDRIDRPTFTPVLVDMKDVVEIVCGTRDNTLLMSDGMLISTGINSLGEFAPNTKYEQKNKFRNIVQVSRGCHHIILLSSNGKLMGGGAINMGGHYVIGRINNVKGVKQVACIGKSTFIVAADNTLMAAGDNSYGQLGLGDTVKINNFKKVMCLNYNGES